MKKITTKILVIYIVFFSSCSNGSEKREESDSWLSKYEYVPEKNDTILHFKNLTNCTENFIDSNCEKSNLKKINFEILQSKSLKKKNLTVKEIISISIDLKAKLIEKKNNKALYKYYLNGKNLDFFDDKFESNEEIDFCNYSKIYFNKYNNIGFVKLLSNNMKSSNLTLFPFFFKNYVYCFCSEANYSFFEKKTNVIEKGRIVDASNNFIFIDKINKIRLCFGIEHSRYGHSDPSPTWWPRLYVLDETLFPLYYIAFRFGDSENRIVDIEYLFKLAYVDNTKYVKGYQEIDFTGLGKTIVYNDSTKYQDVVDFVNLLLEKGEKLPIKKNGYSDYTVNFDSRFFPPIPEWVK